MIMGTVFQSTLPVGGATTKMSAQNWLATISIHAPRGGSDILYFVVGAHADYFNPRSPWGERLHMVLTCLNRKRFQSTLPVGGATAKIHKFPAASLAKVSIFSDTTPEKPYQTGSTAEILCTDSRKSRANLPGIGCTLELRATKSEYPPADRCSCSRNAQPSFRIDSPDNRSGGCPFPGP